MNCVRLLQFAQRRSALSANIFKPSLVRRISGQHIQFMESQEKWRKRDGLSKEWQLIYKAPMDQAIKIITTYLTASTSILVCGGIYYSIFVFDPLNWDTPFKLGEDLVIADSASEAFLYIAAFTLFHAAVRVLISKYVIRMYHNGDEYIAFFRGSWYNTTNKHMFNAKEFKKLNPTFVVTWGDARYGLGKKHGILLEPYFKTPEYLNYLLGRQSEHPDNE